MPSSLPISGRGERDVAAVQEGDGDADENHQHHDIAMAGGLFERLSVSSHHSAKEPSSCRQTGGRQRWPVGRAAHHRLFIDRDAQPRPGGYRDMAIGIGKHRRIGDDNPAGRWLWL